MTDVVVYCTEKSEPTKYLVSRFSVDYRDLAQTAKLWQDHEDAKRPRQSGKEFTYAAHEPENDWVSAGNTWTRATGKDYMFNKTFNKSRVELLLGNSTGVSGVPTSPAPASTGGHTSTPGPRRPAPGLPVEVHNHSRVDPDTAMEAVRLLSKGAAGARNGW